MNADRFVIPDSVAPILAALSLVWLALALTTHLIYRRVSHEPYLRYWAIASYLNFVAVASFSFGVWIHRPVWPRLVMALAFSASTAGFLQPAFLILAGQAIRRPPAFRRSLSTVLACALTGVLMVAASFYWELSRETMMRFVMAPRSIFTAFCTAFLGYRLWMHPRPQFGGVLHKTLCPLLLAQTAHQLVTSVDQLLGTSYYHNTTSVTGALISVALGICTVLGLMYGITEEASRANAAKSTFISTLSHELRTPLAGLVGLTNILSRTRLDHDQRETVRSMDLCAQSILVMVDDILDVTRIEAGRVTAQAIPFSPQTLAQDLLLMLRPTLTAKVELAATVHPNVPDTVLSDPRLLRQILLNLTGNALKFTPQGEVRITLSYNAAETPPLLHIAVSDTGCGIAPQDIPHLLAPFYQGANVKHSNRRGIGLGLHLCQKWLATLGGSHLDIQSTEGAGSVFSFAIPAPAAPPPQPEPITLSSTPQRHLDILIVEDNRINQLVLIRLLESLGHQVKLATNGQDAVTHCQTHTPDLILMDLIMPGMDGVEATQLIRTQPAPSAQVPILALTASTLDAERTRCLNAGMNDFITKPVSIDKLASAVSRWASTQPNPTAGIPG